MRPRYLLEWETTMFSRRLTCGELSTQSSSVVCLVSSETFQGLTRIITVVKSVYHVQGIFFMEINSLSLSSSLEWTLLFSSLGDVEADAEKGIGRIAAKGDVRV